MSGIGCRIVVYGPTGSGKSTIARLIAERIDIPVVELDALFWLPNWIEKSLDRFRADVVATLEGLRQGWVCDGNYSQVRDVILPMADTVVWLRPPFRVVFWWLLKRTVRRAWSHETMWGANRESWRRAFLSRDSILLYQMTSWRRQATRTRQGIKEIPHHASVIELRSRREAEEFIASLNT